MPDAKGSSEKKLISDRSGSQLETPSDDMVRRAIVSVGNAASFLDFLRRAEAGHDLTIGVLGGSITAGSVCPQPEKRYHGVLLEFLRSRYPRSRFSLVNAGIGATDSCYGSFRAERDLLSGKPDMAVLEFAVNDNDSVLWGQSYEGVVRQILTAGCPLILLFMTHDHLQNCQRLQEVIGRHYGLPMVSYRDAVMPELMRGTLKWEALSPDKVHPNPSAHSFAGKLLCALMEKIIVAANAESKQLPPLPEALFTDAFQYTFLMEGDTFCPVVSDGWTKLAEGDRHLRGRWHASQAGRRMEFSFEGTSLWVSYLGIQGAVGRISVCVDDLAPVVFDSFFQHDWPGPKQFWLQAVSGLKQGVHKAVVTLLAEHHPEGGTEFYFCGAGGTR